MTEATLWNWFSKYIRLRDSDDNGYIRCFTCGRLVFWKEADCGHGHGRQHKGTKYNEKNNHAQCTDCNWHNEGRKDRYAKAVDKRYGAGTWDLLEMLSRRPLKLSQFDIDTLGNYYRVKVNGLLKSKHISC